MIASLYYVKQIQYYFYQNNLEIIIINLDNLYYNNKIQVVQ